MSIKRIIAFVALALFVYAGGYVAVYGLKECYKFSGAERSLNSLKPQELQHNMRVTGTLDEGFKVIARLGEQDVTKEIFGIPIGGQRQRVFYLLLLNPEEKDDNRKYCVIAADAKDDVARLEELCGGSTKPFEFTGLSVNISEGTRKRLIDYLQEIYTTDFDIYLAPNVKQYIIPYTIYVTNKYDDSMTAVVAGGAAVLVGAAAIVLLARNTYKKTHMY